MTEQLELFAGRSLTTLSEYLAFLFANHLNGKACAGPLRSNQKALCRTIGHIIYAVITEPDVERHITLRRRNGAGPQTIKHDLKLLTLLFNKTHKWKRKRYHIGGIDCAQMLLPEYNPVADIKKPKTRPRTRIVSPEEFSRWIEHSTERLKERSYFALDTGMSPIDLRRMTVAWYNPQTDCLDPQRHKSGVNGSLPTTNRCRKIILDAIAKKKHLVLDWTNEQKDLAKARRASGVVFWWGRDLRKTYYNRLKTKVAQKTLQRAMLHADPRTGPEHYDVDMGEDLRPAILAIEAQYTTT